MIAADPSRLPAPRWRGGLQLARQLAGRAVDTLLPPQCLACAAPLDRTGAICADCWQRVDFIAPPHCAACGIPFAFDHGNEALCGGCAGAPPPFARARAVMVYDDVARELILGFKHGDRTHGAPAFAGWLARAPARHCWPTPTSSHRCRCTAGACWPGATTKRRCW